MSDRKRGGRALAAMAMPDDLWQLMQDVSGDWEDLNPRQRAEYARQFSGRVAEQAMAMRQYRAQREALAAVYPDGQPAPDPTATAMRNAVYSWDAGGDRSKPSKYR